MPLPAPYAPPWKRLGEDGVALLAWLGLKARELWRRNREGTLPVPPLWPRRWPRLFWPLVLAALLIGGGVLARVWLGGAADWSAVLSPEEVTPAIPPLPEGGATTRFGDDALLIPGAGDDSGVPSAEDSLPGMDADGRVPDPASRPPATNAKRPPERTAKRPLEGTAKRSLEETAERPPAGEMEGPSLESGDRPRGEPAQSSWWPGAPPARDAPDQVPGAESPQAAPSASGDATPSADATANTPRPSPAEQEALRLRAAWSVGEGEPLIAAISPEPATATLTLVLDDAFLALRADARERLAERWRQQALEEGYSHLRLRESQGRLLGREARVGVGMVMLEP